MSKRLFTIDERVRWSAVDKAGIIFYGAYVRFFELAEHLGANRLAVTGHEILVCTSRDTLAARPLPGELKEQLMQFLMTEEAARRELGV